MNVVRVVRRGIVAFAVLGLVWALGGCNGASPPSGALAATAGGGGGGTGGGSGGGNTGGGGSSGSAAFRAVAFNDDLIYGTNQNQQGPAAWVWLMAEVKSGHTNHQPEEATSPSGPWSPVAGVVWSGPALNGGPGPGVVFTFPMPTSTMYYRVSATDGSGNTVSSNVITADPNVSANAASLTINTPSTSNDPNNPAVVQNPTAVGWSGGNGASHVVVLADLTAQQYHTLVEKASPTYSIGTNGDTPILVNAQLTTGNTYALVVISLDANGWGNGTTADLANGLNDFFSPQ